MPLAYQAGVKSELSKQEQALFGAALGFVSGYVNVICCIRYNAFGTLMTGNLLQMVKTYFEHGLRVEKGSGALLPLPVFYGLVICARNLGLLAHHLVAKRSAIGVAPLMAPFQAVSMFIAELSTRVPERWHVWLVAFGFGVQSQVSWPALGLPTMMVTGHMSNIFNTTMQVILGDAPRQDLGSIIVPAVVTCAKVFGAISGASAHRRLRGKSSKRPHPFLLTPISVVQAVLLVLIERRAPIERNSYRRAPE